MRQSNFSDGKLFLPSIAESGYLAFLRLSPLSFPSLLLHVECLFNTYKNASRSRFKRRDENSKMRGLVSDPGQQSVLSEVEGSISKVEEITPLVEGI